MCVGSIKSGEQNMLYSRPSILVAFLLFSLFARLTCKIQFLCFLSSLLFSSCFSTHCLPVIIFFPLFSLVDFTFYAFSLLFILLVLYLPLPSYYSLFSLLTWKLNFLMLSLFSLSSWLLSSIVFLLLSFFLFFPVDFPFLCVSSLPIHPGSPSSIVLPLFFLIFCLFPQISIYQSAQGKAQQDWRCCPCICNR